MWCAPAAGTKNIFDTEGKFQVFKPRIKQILSEALLVSDTYLNPGTVFYLGVSISFCKNVKVGWIQDTVVSGNVAVCLRSGICASSPSSMEIIGIEHLCNQQLWTLWTVNLRLQLCMKKISSNSPCNQTRWLVKTLIPNMMHPYIWRWRYILPSIVRPLPCSMRIESAVYEYALIGNGGLWNI